ncbi:MAG: flavin monoamine oxidase family protein [Dehalococcoidia bacterium]
MPHTPLLTHLHQLAADHALAADLGATPAGVRAARAAGRPLSRRAFVTGAAAGAAGLALAAIPGTARAARKPGPPAPTVAIVGGGIAGMTAAMTLADAGYEATVYEASDRIGGRMYSNTGYWSDGQVSEWAGELVDTGHKTIRSLVQRFKLTLDDLTGAEPVGTAETHYFDGAYYEDLDADFKAIHKAIIDDVNAASYPTTWDTSTEAGRALDDMSIAEWIDSRVPGGRASKLGQLLDVAYNIEYGAETTDQSALNLLYLLGYGVQPGNVQLFGASDERYHIRGGNQQLPAAIAATLPGPIKLGWRMTSIARAANGGVTLRFSTPQGRETVTADRVILTLPFAVLRTLDFAGAGFDARKERAIRELGRGRNGKLQLQFGSRPWNAQGSNGASYADTGYQATWEVSRGQAGARGILVDYTGGDVTGALGDRRRKITFADASTAGVSAEALAFLGQAEPVFPGLTAQWNGKATLSIQHHSPHTLCSYSYWRVGQCHDFGGYEGVAQGPIHFAGEHTSVDFQGYMEGGAETGIRAANEVIEAVR